MKTFNPIAFVLFNMTPFADVMAKLMETVAKLSVMGFMSTPKEYVNKLLIFSSLIKPFQ